MRLTASTKLVVTVCGGILLGWVLLSLARDWRAVRAKAHGDAPDCPWARVIRAFQDADDLAGLRRTLEASVSVERQDASLQIELVRSPQRAFWIKRGDKLGWTGERLLAYLLAEHSWVSQTNGADMVRPGDIVLDCGAHIGVFTYFALERGASKVVAVEPDPVNLECLRRNFAREIASGRVGIVGKGVWDHPAKLVLKESNLNSGHSNVFGDAEGPSVEIEVTSVDILVKELRLSRVDYIKMDIEGAEREALKGARETLHEYRPRLMLDAYHLPDDPLVLPSVIRQAYGGYVSACGPCQFADEQLVPHVIFFHP